MSALREHEVEVLDDLRWITRYGSWVKPLDVGGRDSSHHSRTLAKLCRLGLAERARGGGVFRGSWRYRAVIDAETKRVLDAREAALEMAAEAARARRRNRR